LPDTSNGSELAALRADLDALKAAQAAAAAELRRLSDRQEIFRLVNTYTRGVDRHDVEIMRSVFHPDAIDNHGDFLGDVDAFVEWVNTGHAAVCESHMHNVTTHTCDVDGDTAHAESYVIVILRPRDGEPVRISGGRYLDRLERRDGEWRIALRRVVMDWRARIDGGPWVLGRRGYPVGRWDHDDLSYRRPLELDPDQSATAGAARG
jgi:hypothetical protein